MQLLVSRIFITRIINIVLFLYLLQSYGVKLVCTMLQSYAHSLTNRHAVVTAAVFLSISVACVFTCQNFWHFLFSFVAVALIVSLTS